MLLLALLSMVATVMVAMLAARVAAGLGKILEEMYLQRLPIFLRENLINFLRLL